MQIDQSKYQNDISQGQQVKKYKSTQISNMTSTVTVLEVENKELLEKKKVFSAKAYQLNRKNREQKKVINSLKTSLSNEKQQVSLLKGSVEYQIGLLLIKDVKRPLHWLLIPIKIFRIYMRSKKVKLQLAEKIAEQAIKKSQQARNIQLSIIRNKNKVLASSILSELNGHDVNTLIPINNKICYVIHSSLPYTSNGYATRSHSVAAALTSQGYHVLAITRTGYPLDIDNTITVVKDSLIDGIHYHRLLTPTIKGKSLDSYMKESIDSYHNNFQLNRPAYVIVASSFRHALPAIIAAKRLGIPTIYEVRGFWEITRLSREPSFESSKSYDYQKNMESVTACAADQVFTLTHAMKNELIKRGVLASNITITHNACSPDKFLPIEKNEQLRKSLGIPKDIVVIGYIGSWVHYEGIDDLVSACEILFNEGIEFRCLIVGSEKIENNVHRQNNNNSIIEQIENTKFSNWIIRPGRVPFEKVPDYYSLIDIAPFPRKPLPVTEMVSPLKPLEALSMEKAVIVSSVSALAEMIQDKKTGLIFQKGNINDFADKLKQLILDSELRRSLGFNGRQYIIHQRNWVKTARLMTSTLTKLDRRIINEVNELSYIRKLVLNTTYPNWWKQLPPKLIQRCSYISVSEWKLSETAKTLIKFYDSEFSKLVAPKKIPVLNWKRADIYSKIVPNNLSVLDIGGTHGEFANLIAMNNATVDITSACTKNNELRIDKTGRIKCVRAEDIFSLGAEHKRDIITCFEVIEQLPSHRVAEAIKILSSLAKKKLFISVQLEELPSTDTSSASGHLAQFTTTNILELFPDATFTVLSTSELDSSEIQTWIICEINCCQ